MTEVNDKKVVSDLDRLLRKALYQQSAINKHLFKASKALIQIDQDPEQTYKIKRLVLQYRLDNEDVIHTLLNLHKSLCQAVGIEPINDARVNLENAANAIGSIALKEELSMLGHLLEQLEKSCDAANKLKSKRIAERKLIERLLKKWQERQGLHLDFFDQQDNETELDADARKARTQKYSRTQGIVDGIEHELHSAVELQAYFQFSIAQLTEAYQAYEGLPKFGIIYDYLAGLQGPVSRFFMAQQNGLNLINNISLQFSIALGLDKHTEIRNTRRYLQKLINKTQNVINLQKSLNQEQYNRLNHLKRLDQELKNKVSRAPQPQTNPNESNQAALEHDRLARRTMPFFNHAK